MKNEERHLRDTNDATVKDLLSKELSRQIYFANIYLRVANIYVQIFVNIFANIFPKYTFTNATCKYIAYLCLPYFVSDVNVCTVADEVARHLKVVVEDSM